jgi:hypothetical protein
VLLTGLGDDLCGLLPPLLQAVAYHPPSVDLPAFPVVCLLVVHVEISSLSFPASLVLFWSSCPFCFVLVFSLLFIIQFFFLQGGQSAQGAMLVYPGGGRNIVWTAECLPSRFGASSGVSSPPVFSV